MNSRIPATTGGLGEDFRPQIRRRPSQIKRIKELEGLTVATENVTRKGICSRIFYSVAEITARGDNGVKEERKPNTGFIEGAD